MNRIVIPVYKHPDLCDQILFDLFTHEKDNIETIYVVDDYSQDAELNEVIEEWKEKLPIVHITVHENCGFTISANTGLRWAFIESEVDDVIYLISSDVRVIGKFIDHTNSLVDHNTLVGHRLLSRDTGWNKFESRVFPYLEGYFLVATAHLWNDLGFFDEIYAPNDFEDVDLSTTAISKGYKLAPTQNPNIKHVGGQSIGYTVGRSKITERNKGYFKEKWVNER